MFRKALKLATWHWETKRPYPVRDSIFRLPPLHLTPSRPDTTLAILTTPERINNAVWSARSILVNLPEKPKLLLVVDGTLSEASRKKLTSAISPMDVTSTTELVSGLCDTCPSVVALAGHHPMGRKLGAILALQASGNLIFSDDDVLAFNPLSALKAAFESPQFYPLYLKEGTGPTSAEPSIQKGIESLGLRWLSDINVGFLAIPHNSLNLSLCHQILTHSPKPETWFPDTMILATLLAQLPARALPENTYVSNVQRQFSDTPDVDYAQIHLRHFVTPVRHLMFSRGMQRLSKDSRFLSAAV